MKFGNLFLAATTFAFAHATDKTDEKRKLDSIVNNVVFSAMDGTLIPNGKCRKFEIGVAATVGNSETIEYEYLVWRDVVGLDTLLSSPVVVNQQALGKAGMPHTFKTTFDICCVGSVLALTGTTEADIYVEVDGTENFFDINSNSLTIKCVPHGGSGGEPHIAKWDGARYDYHGECDLVLVDVPKLDLALHIRTQIENHYSYIKEAALQVGHDVLEVHAHGRFLINGESGGDLSTGLGGYMVAYIPPDLNAEGMHIFLVDFESKGKIYLKSLKEFLYVAIVGPQTEEFGTSVGLLGEFPSGRMLGRSGTEMNNANDFGQEWQVSGSDPLLFHTASPHKMCLLPPHPSRRRLRKETSRAIAKACAHHQDPQDREDCIVDVASTGDFDLALATGEY